MIYKVFYQETKERNPHREQTKVLYLDVDATTELEDASKHANSLKKRHLTTLNLLSFYQINT